MKNFIKKLFKRNSKIKKLDNNKIEIVKINEDEAEVRLIEGDENYPPLKMLLFTKDEADYTFKLLREIRNGKNKNI